MRLGELARVIASSAMELLSPSARGQRRLRKRALDAARASAQEYWERSAPRQEREQDYGALEWSGAPSSQPEGSWAASRRQKTGQVALAAKKGLVEALAARAAAQERGEPDPFEGVSDWNGIAFALHSAKPGEVLFPAARLAREALVPHSLFNPGEVRWSKAARLVCLEAPERSVEEYLRAGEAARSAAQRAELASVAGPAKAASPPKSRSL